MAGKAKILKADHSLHQKIGNVLLLKEVFTAPLMEKGQNVIRLAGLELAQKTREEMAALDGGFQSLKSVYRTQPSFIQTLILPTFNIKCKAGIYGFTLASSVAKSLCSFCEKRAREVMVSDHDLEIIAVHLDAMRTIFEDNILGDGGKFGSTVLIELARLTTQ